MTEGTKRGNKRGGGGGGGGVRRRKRRDVHKGTFPCCCLYAVCNSGSYTVTTSSCFRYMCFAIFLSLPLTGISFHGGSIFRVCILTGELFHLTGYLVAHRFLRHCLLIDNCSNRKSDIDRKLRFYRYFANCKFLERVSLDKTKIGLQYVKDIRKFYHKNIIKI